MYRIINSLASAEFNKELGAIEVNFNGHGEAFLYHDTMDIAMNIAVIYGINKWLFTKDYFHDIDSHEFLFFVKKWSKTCSELFEPESKNSICQVALLTTQESHHTLLNEHDWIRKPTYKFNNLNLKVFSSKKEAHVFLTGKVHRQLANF
ncbi:MAG: hypothetical protein RIG62_29535 [Cyclobacteriaceae bacterium]